MKKLVVLGLAAVMALGAPFSVCAAEEETTVEHPSGLKIGCAVQTMSNQVWAQQMEEITKDAKEDGNEVTVVECKENANTQIDQIENFITSGMDVIIVQPVDPDAIEEVCKEALDSDIEVVCWDEKWKIQVSTGQLRIMIWVLKLELRQQILLMKSLEIKAAK